MAELEYSLVEWPLIEQLMKMGWRHTAGAEPRATVPRSPERSQRSGFDEVLLEEVLRDAVHRINLGPDGRPWLDEIRITSMVNALSRISAPNLLEANRAATDLLIKGANVSGLPEWEKGRGRQVDFIDWEHPERNEFTVVNQFRVDVPGTQGMDYLVPDVVLFVNGIPLVVIECKQVSANAMERAVAQIRDYSEQGGGAHKGNRRLFHTVQLTIATSGEEAKLGTITASLEHYVPWRDPYPLTKEQFAEQLSKPVHTLRNQEILAGAVLHPHRLLDIVHNYVTFMPTEDGTIVKAAPRYQQYRAVDKAIKGLRTGATRKRDGKKDRRGGVIWHTQGSGKSLTMTFLVRKLRSTHDLKDTKVVVVTDRIQLQRQLRGTMNLASEHVDVARNIDRTKTLLSRRGPAVVFVMIQKQQDPGARTDGLPGRVSLGELNTDESIVVLVDEAHRTQNGTLHANMREALPNAAMIGFTGTPIMTKKGVKQTTLQIFGRFIDRYRLKEAEQDGVIVPILYEGHTVKGAVLDGRDLDEIFEDEMADLTEEERERLQRRYARKSDVSAAEKLIAAKARNMLRHYVGAILPAGFKAQLVVDNRESTVRYREALLSARDELVAEIEALPDRIRQTPPDEIKSRRQADLVRAARHLDLIKRMDFVPVISLGTSENEKRYEEWTDPVKQGQRVDTFIRPFGECDIAFVIVNAMLLTGFDAPIEQVMYLDRSLKEAELLQAVARVNRTAAGKSFGYVVDYHGVAKNLLDALKIYAREDYDDVDAADVEGALKSIESEIAKLEPRRNRLRMLLTERGANLADIEDCVQVLGDSALRDRFDVELRGFLKSVDAVLPDPAAKPYLPDAKLFGEIMKWTRQRYRVDGGGFDPSAYGAKIRELIDAHVAALGIEQKLPPVELTAPEFEERVEALPSARAKASEMEHAIRHHISVHTGEDPQRYRRLSERLEEILQRFKEEWDQQVLALKDLLTEVGSSRPVNPYGLSRVEEALWNTMVAETATDGAPTPERDRQLADVSHALRTLAVETTRRKDFWSKGVDQEEFRRGIARILLDEGVGEISALDKLSSLLFDVVKSNRDQLVRP